MAVVGVLVTTTLPAPGPRTVPFPEGDLLARSTCAASLPPTLDPTPKRANAVLTRQPVAFVPNLGQWDGPFSHKARMGPMTVFLQDRGWTSTLVERKVKLPDPSDAPMTRGTPDCEVGRGVAVSMQFSGSPGTNPVEEQRLPGVHNYFLGNDPTRWRSRVPLYGAILMTGLYRGIDLRARTQNGHFEYDVLVEPGADLEQVEVAVDGADSLRLDPDGTLVIDTALGPVRQPLPKTWQFTASGQLQEVACRYVLRGETTFGFEANEWDPDLALTVDPGLVFSSYLGGSSDGVAHALGLDASGAVTVGGWTEFTAFPTTAGAFSTTFNGGGRDAFATRFDPSGSTLVYSTYIGGSHLDYLYALAVDANGATTVTGYTYSPDFPTTGAGFQTTSNGGAEVFVTRIDQAGSGLIYSTYLGGSGYDDAHAVAVDANGSATITGTTNSTDFPTTGGAFDATHNGGLDAFVTRLHLSGAVLVYSTYLGGSGDDRGWGLDLDAAGATTISGDTLSADFPATPGAFDTTHNGSTDAFVARVDSSASALLYSTYLGGSSHDLAFALALDAAGGATVFGQTLSTDFPTTPGAFSSTHTLGYHVLVARLDPAGSTLVYSTFLAAGSSGNGNCLAVDAAGTATVCGYGGAFPTTAGAFDTTFNGGYDAFLSRLDATGNTLFYSTLLGGSGNDYAMALALDSAGAVTVAGYTTSTNFPTTQGAFDTTHNGGSTFGYDAFVTRFDLGTTIGLSQPAGPGTPITLNNAYLTPGNEYFNIFSLDLCPAGPGTGPYLGLCATTLANAQFILLQASLPLGSPPFHFIAPTSSVSWGPYTVGPGTLDALCLEVTGGVLGSYSSVTRITIQ
jgi:hypothetical protein